MSATEENTVYDADSKFSARWITAVEFQGMNQLFVAKPLQSGPVVVRSCRVYLQSFRHDRRARLRGSKDPGQRTASRRRLYCYLRLPLLRVSSSAIENRNWAYAIEEERATGWGSDPWRNQQQSCHDLLRSADNGKVTGISFICEEHCDDDDTALDYDGLSQSQTAHGATWKSEGVLNPNPIYHIHVYL